MSQHRPYSIVFSTPESLYGTLARRFDEVELDPFGEPVPVTTIERRGRRWELRALLIGRVTVEGTSFTEDNTVILARRGGSVDPPIVVAFTLTDMPDHPPYATYVVDAEAGARVDPDGSLATLPPQSYAPLQAIVDPGVSIPVQADRRYFFLPT
jgi:hypothetical protein